MHSIKQIIKPACKLYPKLLIFEDNYYKMINLIDERGEINPELSAYPNAAITLSIFGTQASGKSSLLNETFQSQFPVLDALKSRGRCTKGVWLQNLNNRNIIDTQGFDSAQRTEEQKVFQKQISLFCVALSDVILINMFMNEIGRYSGGHIDILEVIFKVGERLVMPQQKKIIFIIRDCAEDADKKILQEQLAKEIKSIQGKFQNKMLKFSIEFYFMSHFVYQPELFRKEASNLLKLISIKKTSDFNNYNYNEKDRLMYIRQLWKKIKLLQNQIDLKSLDDAIKNHVFERLKNEVLGLLENELAQMQGLDNVKTYQRYIQSLKKISLEYLSENRPKHIKISQLQIYSDKITEIFSPTAIKYFNDHIIKNIEDQLESRLTREIEKNKNNKTLSSSIFKKRRQIIDSYKKIILNHRQYSLFFKAFNERISEIILKEERKLSHLFSIFESYAEKQLNTEIDKQVSSLVFKPELINQRIKQICQEYQYNQWEVNFKEIWQKVSFRCIQKQIPAYLQEKSLKCNEDLWILSGNQTTKIIAFHTKMEKRALDFCRDILQFLHEENIFSQPLSRVKQIVSQCLGIRLLQENKRYKISLLFISIVMLLLYNQLETLLGWTMKKKKRGFWLRCYWYASISVLAISIYNSIKEKYYVKPRINN